MKLPKRFIFTACLFLLILGPGSTRVEAGDLAVVVRPGLSSELADIRTALSNEGYDLGSVAWFDSRLHVYLATSPTGIPAHQIAAAIRAAELSGLILTGELFHRDGDRFQIASGQVLVEFRRGTTREEAERWADSLGMTLLDNAPHSRWSYLLDAPVSAGSLVALQRLAGSDPVVRVTPLIHDVGERASPARTSGVSHSVPRQRNILGVVLRRPATRTSTEQTIARSVRVTNMEDWSSKVWLLKFDNENDLIMVEKKLLAKSQNVLHVGAAISVDPPAILNGYLAVKYKLDSGPTSVAAILDLDLDFDLDARTNPRILPYVPNGFLYGHHGYGYSIYDTVEALMDSGAVHYAIPDLYIPSRDAATDDCPAIEFPDNHDYLQAMKLCESWDVVESVSRQVNIGLLDQGVGADSTTDLACSELDMGYMASIDTLTECDPSSSGANWCATCANIAGEGGDHGIDMGLFIGATHSDPVVLGINPEAHLFSTKRYTLEDDFNMETTVHYADTLIWMAGGNPNWSCGNDYYECDGTSPPLPTPLGNDHRADIINLSFALEDFLERERDCVAGPEDCFWDEDCIVVCDGVDTCGLIGDALRVLRKPALFPDSYDQGNVREKGVVVVAAVGGYGSDPTDDCDEPADVDLPCFWSPIPKPFSSWNQHTDLAASPDTIAVGSVYEDHKPYSYSGSQYCSIQWEGDYLDVVAPMRDGDTSYVPSDFVTQFDSGASSAATAVVSGIASLMLKVSPTLTPAQVQCILRKTANKDLFADIPSWGGEHADAFPSWSVEYADDCRVDCEDCGGYTVDCGIDCGHSRCVGYGMVDAYAAVLAAQACAEPAAPATVEGVVLSDVKVDLVSEDTDDGDAVEDESPLVLDPADREPMEVIPEYAWTLAEALTPSCPCPSEDGVAQASVTRGPYAVMSRNLSQPVDLEIDEEVMRFLECLSNGKCRCMTDPNCINFDLINEHEDIWHDVEFKACIDERCWDLPARFPEWKPGQEYTVPMVIDRMIPAMWRATGELPVLKAYSRGVEIQPLEKCEPATSK